MRASEVLGDVAGAINRRLARHAAHELLWRIADLLTASPVDVQKLHAQLMMIPDDMITLGRYFKTLSNDELKVLLGALRSESPDVARHALSQITDGSQEQALIMLFIVGAVLGDAIIERAPPGLLLWIRNLDLALGAGNEDAVSEALYRLSELEHEV